VLMILASLSFLPMYHRVGRDSEVLTAYKNKGELSAALKADVGRSVFPALRLSLPNPFVSSAEKALERITTSLMLPIALLGDVAYFLFPCWMRKEISPYLVVLAIWVYIAYLPIWWTVRPPFLFSSSRPTKLTTSPE
jgi:hypothetical protein